MADEQHNAEVWKQKYLAAREDAQEKEAHYADALKQLRMGLSRVSVAAMGVDDTLDQQLSLLRKSIRDEADAGALQKQLESMSKTLKRLDVDTLSHKTEIITALESLVEPISQIELPKPVEKQLSALRKQLRAKDAAQKHAELIQEYQGVLHALINYLKESLQHDPAMHSPTSSVDLGDKSSPVAKSMPPPEPVSRSKPAEHEAPAASLLTRLLTGKASTDEVPTEVAESLTRILDKLSTQIKVKEHAEEAKKKLNHATIGDLVSILEEISLLVDEAFTSDQRRLESFLTKLNTQLKDVETMLLDNQESAQKTQHLSERLNAEVCDQVEVIQRSIDEAENLDALTKALEGRLDTISNCMDEYREMEQKRVQDTQSQVEQLQQQLRQTEADAGKLQATLNQQKATARQDPLTLLPNRLAYDEQIFIDHEDWLQHGGKLTLGLADIDYFKKINDTYGHLAGDKVLAKMAELLRALLPKEMFIARYGGEEFAIIVRGRSSKTVAQLFDVVREKIEAYKFHFRGQPVPVTLSFGVTTFLDEETIESAFARADEALYKSKQAGRNRTTAK